MNALLQSGERTLLVGSFRDPVEVIYLERTLEEKLKLRDQRVPGDWVG